ncbi:S24 family peptidase [Candidatus Magnetaquicoccus inordinatus]|uniref:S24 family peptidase n=1 Tax=Candidatus Magnetaquicoccus inordinatus TaxID=2496818 RepID=UPI00102B6F4B|nr:S24 family peptidase [Candidatus Magnetaquicoccus inordinatus]
MKVEFAEESALFGGLPFFAEQEGPLWQPLGASAAASDERISDFVLIPHIRAEASLGAGADCYANDDIIGHLAFKSVWLQKKRLNPKFLALIDAVGDSMAPTIGDGDLLLVDLRQKEPLDNRIFVIRMDQQLYAKRLRFQPGNKLVIQSDNPHSPAFAMDRAESAGVDILGRVVWAGKDL